MPRGFLLLSLACGALAGAPPLFAGQTAARPAPPRVLRLPFGIAVPGVVGRAGARLLPNHPVGDRPYLFIPLAPTAIPNARAFPGQGIPVIPDTSFHWNFAPELERQQQEELDQMRARREQLERELQQLQRERELLPGQLERLRARERELEQELRDLEDR